MIEPTELEKNAFLLQECQKLHFLPQQTQFMAFLLQTKTKLFINSAYTDNKDKAASCALGRSIQTIAKHNGG